jgi:hypothetical protein
MPQRFGMHGEGGLGETLRIAGPVDRHKELGEIAAHTRCEDMILPKILHQDR